MIRPLRWFFLTVLVVCLGTLAWYRFRPPVVTAPRAAGPDFHVRARDLSNPLQIVAYGDMRFTDPAETEATNPKVRRWLVDRIAAEKPDAVLLSGDIPWHGGHAAITRSIARKPRSGAMRICIFIRRSEITSSRDWRNSAWKTGGALFRNCAASDIIRCSWAIRSMS